MLQHQELFSERNAGEKLSPTILAHSCTRVAPVFSQHAHLDQHRALHVAIATKMHRAIHITTTVHHIGPVYLVYIAERDIVREIVQVARQPSSQWKKLRIRTKKSGLFSHPTRITLLSNNGKEINKEQHMHIMHDTFVNNVTKVFPKIFILSFVVMAYVPTVVHLHPEVLVNVNRYR